MPPLLTGRTGRRLWPEPPHPLYRKRTAARLVPRLRSKWRRSTGHPRPLPAMDGRRSPPAAPSLLPKARPFHPSQRAFPEHRLPPWTGVTAAQPPAAVQPSMEQRPAQRAELPSAPASPQTDKKEDTPDPQKLMLYQNRLALGGVVGNVLGKVRDAMTPQQNKPKTQQSSQATQADATSQQSVQAPQANMEQRFAAFEASRMEPRARRSEAVRCRSICPHRPRCTKHIQRRTRRIDPQPHPGCRFDNSRWNTTGSRGNASRRRL